MVEEEKKKYVAKVEDDVTLVRLLGKDIRGDIKLMSALTKIKGVSWAFSNAICKTLNLDKEKRVQDFDKKELDKIEVFIKNSDLPGFLKNRRKDFDDGEDKHIVGADLKLRTEFDVKRLRKIRSYRGSRHAANLPTRGQRTRSNFRRNRKPSVAAAKRRSK